jgi:hypothetical protein
MKILCTGNVNKRTIAWAATNHWPHTDTVSLSAGYDFLSDEGLEKFKSMIAKYNIFINSSYIATGVQSKLLDLTVQKWMELDINGHIFNLGTTLEWDNLNNNEYIESKLNLRKKSLEYNKETGITGVKSTYLILGGVDNGEPENKDFVPPDTIIKMIDYILTFPGRIGFVQLDAKK